MTTPDRTKRAVLIKQAASTFRDVFRFALRRVREERIAQVASSLTFTTVLALVPLMTIIFAVLTALPIFAQLQSHLREWFLQNLVPTTISETIFRYLNQFAAKARGLTLIGTVFFVFTALSTVLTIDRALNTIWHVRRPRPLARRLLVYWTVLTVGPIVLAGSLTLSSWLFGMSTGNVQQMSPVLSGLLSLLSPILMTLVYAALYVYVPNCDVAWRDALIGGLCAAVALDLAKRGFGIYLASFRTITIVYGALATLPLFLLWIYFSWLITLIGASIAASLPTLYDRSWNRDTVPGQAYADVLRLLRTLYRARAGKWPGLTLDQIRAELHLNAQETEGLLTRLEAHGIVNRMQIIVAHRTRRDEIKALWIFAADPQAVKLERLFRLFAFDGKRAARAGLALNDPLAKSVRNTQMNLAEQSLADIFLSESDGLLDSGIDKK